MFKHIEGQKPDGNYEIFPAANQALLSDHSQKSN